MEKIKNIFDIKEKIKKISTREIDNFLKEAVQSDQAVRKKIGVWLKENNTRQGSKLIRKRN